MTDAPNRQFDVDDIMRRAGGVGMPGVMDAEMLVLCGEIKKLRMKILLLKSMMPAGYEQSTIPLAREFD